MSGTSQHSTGLKIGSLISSSTFWGGLSGSLEVLNAGSEITEPWSFSFTSKYSDFDFYQANETAILNDDGTYTVTVSATAGSADIAADSSLILAFTVNSTSDPDVTLEEIVLDNTPSDGMFQHGSAHNDRLVGGQYKDIIIGDLGKDTIKGKSGNDILIGDNHPHKEIFNDKGYIIKGTKNLFKDRLEGHDGNDLLIDQLGSDHYEGGEGNDHLISLSDSGIPEENKAIPAGVDDGDDLNKLQFKKHYINPASHASNDSLIGGSGTDTFEWRLAINASKAIVDKHTDDDGVINWGMNGVAGENTNYHDHWVDGIGKDKILDFSGTGGEGDQIIIDGHTVKAMIIKESKEISIIGIYSDQGADGERGNGAHDLDILGTIDVYHDGNFSFENDVTIKANDYGAYGNNTGISDLIDNTEALYEHSENRPEGIFKQGSTTDDKLIGSGKDDLILGNQGSDVVKGKLGNDILVGDNGPAQEDYNASGFIAFNILTTYSDKLQGGGGDDTLLDQFGSDHYLGGEGNDHLICLSDSGTPDESLAVPADIDDGDDLNKLIFSSQYINPSAYSSHDKLSGGSGSDIFEWRLSINASKEIVEKHTNTDGVINWGMNGVAGENNNYHDHWVDGIGMDLITDFSGAGGEGDKIIIAGHTVKAMLIDESNRISIIGVYSDQGADGKRGNGAHDLDVLGTIEVRHDGNFSYVDDVSIQAYDYGAYGDNASTSELY